MNSLSLSRLTSLALCTGILLASTAPVQAFKLPEKKYWLPVGVALIAFGRLATKDDPDKDRLTLDEAIEGLKDSKKRKHSLAEHVMKFLDHVVVGFAGKKRGPRVIGSKWVVEGESKLIKTMVYPEGEKLEFYHRDAVPPYGFMGISYAYIMGTLKALKDVKEGNETLRYFGIEVYRP